MFKRKYFIILLILLISICSITAISAVDTNNSQNEINNEELFDNNLLNDNLDSEVLTDEDNVEESSTEETAINEDNNDESLSTIMENNAKLSFRESGTYFKEKKLTYTLKDNENKAISNKTIFIQFSNGISSNITTDINGTAIYYPKFNPGTYTVVATVITEGILANSSSETFKISKIPINIVASKVTSTYASGKTLKIKVTDSKTSNPLNKITVKLKIYTGKKYITIRLKTNSKGIANYKLSKLSSGLHKIQIDTDTTKIYSKGQATSSAKINPKSLKFRTAKSTLKNGGMVAVQVQEKGTKKDLNNIKVKFLIYTGKKYKTITLTTGYDNTNNGVAGIITNAFSVGSHKVVIKPVSKNYAGTATSQLVITKNAKLLYKKWHEYHTGGKTIVKIY